MTIDAPPYPDDEADQLDRFLDELIRGSDGDESRVETGIEAFARRVHAASSREDDRELARTDADRGWERLVEAPRPTAIPRSRSRYGDGTLGIVAPGRVSGRPVAFHEGARLALTLVAVLVLVAAALSLSRQGPGLITTPTVMAAEGQPTSTRGAPAVPTTVVIQTATVETRFRGDPATCTTVTGVARRSPTTSPARSPSQATIIPSSDASQPTEATGCILTVLSGEANVP